ncbi:DNA polymerase [Mycena kentingensis (nom. inval.)]|nr:DNA polymerase [Mycena kentingensis (nom. inval.)]
MLVTIRHPQGASADIHLYGATVVSWKSASKLDPNPTERLFVSSSLDRPIRGGIPVVFPCFGAPSHTEHLDLAQHGFARNSVWSWDGSIRQEGDTFQIFLTLEPNAAIQKLYTRPFHLTYIVTLAQYELSTELREFQALFHNYLAVPAADTVLVTPLQGLAYFDKTESTEEGKATAKTEARAGVDVRNFTDSVYVDAPQNYEVIWPGGGVAINTSNLKDVVVWNPQVEAGSKIGDMEAGGWERFVCCEPGHVRGFASVAPGMTWQGKQTLSVIHHAPCSKSKLTMHIDYYLAPPGPLDNSDLPAVPVVRIFGPSSLGPKCCVHIHQVYPYFYIEYHGSLEGPRIVKWYIKKLAKSLNVAIALSMKKAITVGVQHKFIRAITLVKGVDFYGFHSAYTPFLKLSIVNPALLTRAITLLRSGAIFSTNFRVYEGHLSFALQVAVDFGLAGCAWLKLSDALERGQDEDEIAHAFPASPYFRQSTMPLEFDAAAYHITNRHDLTARNIHHKLQIPQPPFPPDPLVLGVRELWDDERERRRARGLDPTPVMPADPSDASRFPRGQWTAEARYWDGVRQRIERDRALEVPSEPGHDWERWTMTAFESVEALWPKENRTTRSPTDQPETLDTLDELDAECDISMSAEELSEIVDDAEELDLEREGSEPPGDDASEYDGEEEIQSDPDADETRSPSSPGSDGEGSPTTSASSGDVFEDSQQNSPKLPPNRDDAVDFDEEPLTPTRSRVPDCLVLGTSPDSLAESPHQDRPPPAKRRRITFMPDLEDKPLRSAAYLVSHRAMTLKNTTNKKIGPNCYDYGTPPPSTAALRASMDDYSIPSKIYQRPFFDCDGDVSDKPRQYGGVTYFVPGNPDSLSYLAEWTESQSSQSPVPRATTLPLSSGWEYMKSPPSRRRAKTWLASNPHDSHRLCRPPSQVEGPTPANIYGLKTMPDPGAGSVRGGAAMSILSLEIFAPSNYAPDPENDEMVAAFLAYRDEKNTLTSRMIFVDKGGHVPELGQYKTEGVSNELDLTNAVIDVVLELDPDIIVGWEVQRGSWGYVDERARQFDLDLVSVLSRAPDKNSRRDDQWSARQNASFKVVGRHVLNLWRVMRSEVTLNVYDFENVAFHVLGRRYPRFGPRTLNKWYQDSSPEHKSRIFRYFSERCIMNLDILEQTEVVTKTAEFARVFGVDWFSVLSRGSQFKVESFMFRIAKPENFVLVSASKQDVGRQNAAEAMPLIMEPDSAFYTDPVLVLDFQSLYPSIMIAYNYCYSTFLGRVNDFQGRQKFGVIPNLDLQPGRVESLVDHITMAPNGMMFVKPEVRRGLLGRMLIELLDTRVMVKQAMKGVGDDKALKRVLNARQLGLKYIANVTYGYTSATFSGRMPAVEIADSIVQTGRETLEAAINYIKSEPRWGAHVVYGDTDSLFVHLPGKTRDQAFRIGEAIAAEITSRNPSPIKLKFEKVYLPCVLLAKKRYVGYKYEHPDEAEPSFDAKGIETVRRDGVPAQRKMTEQVLRMLFKTRDLSKIKTYCLQFVHCVRDITGVQSIAQRSWSRILDGRASVEDFTFAKEVRMGGYKDTGAPPPGAVLAARQAITDRTEAQYKERVRYVICYGPGERLVDRVHAPLDVLNNRSLRVDGNYYISRVLVPPLDRILSLTGADIRQWWAETPKQHIYLEQAMSPSKPRNGAVKGFVLDEHFYRTQCLACNSGSDEDLCEQCRFNLDVALTQVSSKFRLGEQRLLDLTRICSSCSNTPLGEPIECESLSCSVLYARKAAEAQLDALEDMQNVLVSGIPE